MALLEEQRGLVSAWQLAERGCTPAQRRHARGQLRVVHHGVWASGHAPLTDWQRWRAATLTAPGTVLADDSCGAMLGFWRRDGTPITVRRRGSGGPKTFGRRGHLSAIRVAYADPLPPSEIVHVDGIPSLSAARTVFDLTRARPSGVAGRIVRDALRLKCASPVDLRAQLALRHGERGAANFRRLVDEFAPLGLGRTRSDAEALALALLTRCGAAPDAVNRRIAGDEADLIWWMRRLILELDGPQFHQFPSIDAEKQAAWEREGFVVRRLSTDVVYDAPHQLLEAAATDVSADERSVAASTRSAQDVLARWSAAGQHWTGPS